MMNPDMEKRITPEVYDGIGSRFVTEYGYIGPCSMKTIERYHGDAPVQRGSEIWNWHNNTFEKETVVAGIGRHYVDPNGLSLEDYLLYAGLCQALMLGYSLEALRYSEVTNGALFWMYADCWGEVGWTVVDYYLDRKPAYYAVKRAFAPRRIVLRREGVKLGVMLANDTPSALALKAELGFVSFDGSVRDLRPVTLKAAAFSRGWELFEEDLSRATGDGATGLLVVLPKRSDDAGPVLPAFLRPGPFRTIAAPRPTVEKSIETAQASGGTPTPIDRPSTTCYRRC